LAYAKGNTIMLENLPKGAKVDVYDLQGKHVYSTTNHAIPVQSKGMYILKVSGEILRVVVQ